MSNPIAGPQDQAPRFLLFCLWPVNNNPPGKPVQALAERDDANSNIQNLSDAESVHII